VDEWLADQGSLELMQLERRRRPVRHITDRRGALDRTISIPLWFQIFANPDRTTRARMQGCGAMSDAVGRVRAANVTSKTALQ
jgi:hypothetical protein